MSKLINSYERERDQAALSNVSPKNYYCVISKRLYPSDKGLPLCDVPLYKGKGDKTDPNSLGLLVKHRVQAKCWKVLLLCLQSVKKNNFLSDGQNGFCFGKFTVKNLLCTDKYLFNEINDDHHVDVILLHFVRAFDKVSYYQLLNCLALFNFSYWLELV